MLGLQVAVRVSVPDAVRDMDGVPEEDDDSVRVTVLDVDGSCDPLPV